MVVRQLMHCAKDSAPSLQFNYLVFHQYKYFIG